MTLMPTYSDAEAMIRVAVVARIRNLLPAARIIHEINVDHGAGRADIAAVEPGRLHLFEIKSQRDTLHRLPQQLRIFRPVCHTLTVVADSKWCGRATAAGYSNCDARKMLTPCTALWEWGVVEDGGGVTVAAASAVTSTTAAASTWNLHPVLTHPWHHHMLMLCWTEELREIAAALELEHKLHDSGASLCASIAANATGADIELAVCRVLRRRHFAWADAPEMGS